MRTAADVMNRDPITVRPDLPVQDLANLLLDGKNDGACVVEDGRLVGVVTTMDLIYREKRVHLPTFFWFLDAMIPLESPFRTQREVAKIAAATVRDLMTTTPIVAEPSTLVDAVASMMIDHHVSLVPVVDQGRLVGVVTKAGMLREAFGIR
jgi:CBS domain-containing protein